MGRSVVAQLPPNPDRVLLESITTAQSRLAASAAVREVFEGLLDDLLKLTDSEYGFIGEVLEDDQGRHLKTHAITNIAWNEETQRFYEEKAPRGLEFRNLDTLFGHTVRTEELLIANEAAHHPAAAGIPEGHPALSAFLGLPLHVGGELVGMVGIANRPGGYDEALVDFLRPFTLTCATIVASLRIQAAKEHAMHALAANEVFSRAILDNAVDAIITVDERGTIRAVHGATVRMLGYRQEQLVGENVQMLMPAVHRTAHDDYMTSYHETGVAKLIGKRRVVPVVRCDGVERDCEITISPIEVDGEALYVGALRDVTAQRRQEAERSRLTQELSRRVEELDALDRDNSTFAELVSFLQACRVEEEMYEVVTTFGTILFASGAGGFFLASHDGRATPVASFDGKPAAMMPVFDKQDCWALRRGDLHYRDEHAHRGLVCRHCHEGHIASLCVPVTSQDGPVGVLVLTWSDAPPEATVDRAKRLLLSLADRLGAAVSNLRLRSRLGSDL